ncbi:Cloroperoxidase [Aspergillus ruber CBS 135680]|uniref:Cloroperoxidase n=1 Tax=Aspergillus ruber (strain CBS 135680) TaxID=1388766 RepID=A0A017SPY5_ASPRC|nr:Cloroperoxidase [Aspergillus ruber CBS 135680]EYE98335.1 Cloroperoxidase [Aspergillus ruber CBS 135680]
MKFILLLITTAFTLVQTLARQAPHPLPWSSPGPGAVRAPCPMLNTLANHSFLPHGGKDISEAPLITNPHTNATKFCLNDLNRHNILEHDDASLSRQDAYFGDNVDFNQIIFDETRSYWPHSIVDIQTAARSSQTRVNISIATNPTYNMCELGLDFSYGEIAAYILILGSKYSGKVNRSWVKYLFENERLAVQLSWASHNETITSDDLNKMLEMVVNAPSTSYNKRSDIVRHGGMHTGRRA